MNPILGIPGILPPLPIRKDPIYCEIEFLPVGDASKAGDAIVVRYGTPQSYELMIIDGGNIDSGKLLVEHVREHFGSSAVISHVLLTHADTDHASGLREVLAELSVRNLWMHSPFLCAEASLPYFLDKRWTVEGLRQKLFREYDLLNEIRELAIAKQVSIHTPFAGEKIGPFQVLSPLKKVYELLLPQFDRTPEPDQAAIAKTGLWLEVSAPPTPTLSPMSALAHFLEGPFEQIVAKVQNWVPEAWNSERLKDGGVTSASNESSVVLYGDFGIHRRVLLTGDAGNLALTLAAAYAEKAGLPLQDFMFVQIPHHGSRRNVGPTILNRLLGPIQPQGSQDRFTAFVSAPKDDAVHPRKMVLNAFKRRGASVIATQGIKKCFRDGFPARFGYINAELMPFFPNVEEYD